MTDALKIAPGGHRKEMENLLRANARRHRLHEVFVDFCEMMALAISNSVDKGQFEAREARYLQIVKKYEREEVERFTKAFAVLVLWLDCGFHDALGELFMSLELGDSFKGQFFTPYPISQLMAAMVGQNISAQVQEFGYITVNEPACGAAGMLIALMEAAQSQKVNYQRCIHATAQDIDATAVHMAYIQLTLFHVPAIVIHGNTLALSEWAHWVTPAHVLGGWDFKLKRRKEFDSQRAQRYLLQVPSPIEIEEAAEPVKPAGMSLSEAAEVVAAKRLDQLSLF